MINALLHEDSGLTCKSDHETSFLSVLHMNSSLIREAGFKDIVMWCGDINSTGKEKQRNKNRDKSLDSSICQRSRT